MADEGFERKLTAILSADVEGYSRLMGDDEEATVRTLTSYRNTISNLVQQYRGRIVDSPGDNILAEFKSVVDAVNCAVEIQRDLGEQNAELSDERKMQFRIGVNLGDVIDEDERIYGDGVNIAARIESLSDAGGICISHSAYDQIKNKLKFGYEYIGEHNVKNIMEPVKVYRVLMAPEFKGKLIGFDKKASSKGWIWVVAAAVVVAVVGLGFWQFYGRRPTIEAASEEKMAYPLPEKPSIAVLPFDNLSSDKEQEYFCDGLSEGIINGLAKNDRLFVIARNSTFTYKGKHTKVKQIAEDLGVRYVLEGSIQKAGDRVRVTAQLIDALSGYHLFSERFDRELKDIFRLQDEITKKVLTELLANLTLGTSAAPYEKGTDNLDAYLKVMQARDYKNTQVTKERVLKAMQLLEEAIALDPEYAPAYSILSTAHFDLVTLGASDDPKKSLRTAIELGNKAIALDESNPSVHAHMVYLFVMTKNFDKAFEAAEKAVSLSPNYAGGYFALGFAFVQTGQYQKAIPALEKCLRLSPTPISSNVLVLLANSYKELGKYEEAITTFKKALHIFGQDQLFVHIGLAQTYVLMGLKEEAQIEAAEILRIDPDFSIVRFLKPWPMSREKKDQIAALLRKAGLPDHPALPLPDKPSIAVLPFVNMSDDPEQEYFSDGLTDELIGDLAKISGILVISRNSAFTYKGKQVKIAQIAKDLNVRYVLEGSVQKSGDKVRIRAQLIDGQTDHHLWAESYDGMLNDIFDLQDKITSKIVSALAVKLSSSEKEKIADKGTENVLAYEAFLKGRKYYVKQTPTDFLKAIEYFKQAIKIDPSFTRAYAEIGLTYQFGSNLAWSREMGIETTTLRLLARHYLELAMKDPSAEAYSLAAAKELQRRNFQKSLVFAEKAYSYAPNSPDKMMGLGWILAFTGRAEESIELFKKAIRLDPLETQTNTQVCYIWIGINYFVMGNLEEAIAYLEKGLSHKPNNNFSCFLAASHALLGHDAEAKKALSEWLKIYKTFPPSIQYLYNVWPFKDSKVFDRFAQGLIKAGLRGGPKNYYKVNEDNKLKGEEIRKLLFGKTFAGYIFGIKQLIWSYNISDDGTLTFNYRDKNSTGKAWIEGEKICLIREQYADGLKSCEEIYRNPDGDELAKTEYFRVTDYGFFLFSVEK